MGRSETGLNACVKQCGKRQFIYSIEVVRHLNGHFRFKNTVSTKQYLVLPLKGAGSVSCSFPVVAESLLPSSLRKIMERGPSIPDVSMAI